MSAAPVSCDTCRAAIPESDFETGAAISVLGKSYCGVCKNKAVQDISLEDLLAQDSPQPGAVAKSPPRAPSPPPRRPLPAPTPRPSPRPAATPFENMPTLKDPVKPAPAQEKSAPSRRKVIAASPSKGPLLVLAGLAVTAAVLVVVILQVSGRPKKGGTAPDGTATVDPDPAPPADPAAARRLEAERAYNTALIVSNRSDAPFDEILAAIDKARPAVAGTPWESKLEELRNRKGKEKDAIEAQKKLGPVVDELKAAVAADRDFKQYGPILLKFQAARELALKSGGAKQAEIQQLQSEYTTAYEKAAEPLLTDIQEAATQLASERRFDDALKHIDSFPLHLRQSGAWRILDRLRADIERRKAASK